MAMGVDFGQSSLKIVDLRRGLGSIRVAGMARKRVAHLRPSELPHLGPRALQEALSGGAVGSRAVVGVGGREINLQMRIVPSSKLTNYPKMMRNEIRNQRMESPDLTVDYVTLRTPDAYYPRYLSVIGMGKSSYVEERLGIVRSAGLQASEVVPAPFALYAAYRRAYGAEGGVALLLNIGADSIDMILVRGGRLIFARNLTQGARLFDEQVKSGGIRTDEEAEYYKIRFGSLGADGGDQKTEEIRPVMRQAAWQLVGVLKSSLAYAKNQLDEQDLTVDRVYVSGGGAKLPGLVAYLKSALGAPVEPLDPFRTIDTSLIRRAGEQEALGAPSDMAVAVGLALIGLNGGSIPHVSLLPDPVRARRRARRTAPFLVAAAAVMFATLGVLTFTGWGRRDAAVRDQRRFEAEAERIQKNVRQLDDLEAKIRKAYARHDVLQAETAGGAGIMEVYSKLRRLIREGVIVESMELQDPRAQPRGIFNLRERGHMAGPFVRTERGVSVQGAGTATEGEVLNVETEAGDVVPQSETWQIGVRRLMISGEVDENVPGGPHNLLIDMARQLTDPTNFIRCSLHREIPSDARPGWRAYQLIVEFE